MLNNKHPKLHVDSTSVPEAVFKAFGSLSDEIWDSIPGIPVASFTLEKSSSLYDIISEVENIVGKELTFTFSIAYGDYFISGCQDTEN